MNTTQPEGSVPLLVFLLGDQRCALPVSAVERVLPMAAVSPLPDGPAVALGILNLHGQPLPVLDVRRRFGFPLREYGVAARLLVARTDRRRVLLPVDGVDGIVEVERAAIVAPAAILPGIGRLAGVVAQPDGLLLIHDLDGFLSLEESDRLERAMTDVRGAP